MYTVMRGTKVLHPLVRVRATAVQYALTAARHAVGQTVRLYSIRKQDARVRLDSEYRVTWDTGEPVLGTATFTLWTRHGEGVWRKERVT